MEAIKYLSRLVTGGIVLGSLVIGNAQAGVAVNVAEANPLGNGIWSNSLTLPIQSGSANYFSGFQTIKVVEGASTNTFLAFCLDPFQWSSASYTSYTKTTLDAYFSAATIEKIGDLYSYNNTFENALSGPNANRNAGALQLALWEVVNDDSNLSTGGVKKTGSTNANLVADTQALLNNYASYSGPAQYNFTFYKSSTNQDFIVASPIPEPETLVMMLAGLGLVGAVARRRKAKAA